MNHKIDDMLVYNLATNNWTTLSTSNAPNAMSHAASAILNDTMFVFGGELSNGNLTNELWKFDITGHAWTLLSNNSVVVAPVAGHTMNIVNQKLYIYGGK